MIEGGDEGKGGEEGGKDKWGEESVYSPNFAV